MSDATTFTCILCFHKKKEMILLFYLEWRWFLGQGNDEMMKICCGYGFTVDCNWLLFGLSDQDVVKVIIKDAMKNYLL